MELRHLRHSVAIAESGSLTLAAEKTLHTAQPSLSRQIRHLEHEVRVQLLNRPPQGTELTAAGHARSCTMRAYPWPRLTRRPKPRAGWWRNPPKPLFRWDF